MKPKSTFLLKAAVLILGLIVLALCIFILPIGISQENAGGYHFILIGMYVTAVPFFIALYQTLILLRYIDKNKAFSDLSVSALKCIKYCASIISVLYAAGMPYVYYVAKQDGAPGVIVIGLIITFASAVIALLAAVLQRILSAAIAIKSENDLTI